jgi:aconitate hydratase
MAEDLARQLIAAHLVEGEMRPGSEIGLKIDQILLHDATGPLCALQLEAMGVDEARAETAVAYVDHLLVEGDSKNADDHVLLLSAARRFGMWFSRAGNGTSHPVHQQRFGVPGRSLLGADSHTPAAGGIGMLAIGAGGLEISLALAGEPFRLPMPEIWGVRLTGRLPDWVSAKDVILEILRRAWCRWGAWPHHRVLRARCCRAGRHGSARDRQYGGGSGRYHDGVSVG